MKRELQETSTWKISVLFSNYQAKENRLLTSVRSHHSYGNVLSLQAFSYLHL